MAFGPKDHAIYGFGVILSRRELKRKKASCTAEQRKKGVLTFHATTRVANTVPILMGTYSANEATYCIPRPSK